MDLNTGTKEHSEAGRDLTPRNTFEYGLKQDWNGSEAGAHIACPRCDKGLWLGSHTEQRTGKQKLNRTSPKTTTQACLKHSGVELKLCVLLHRAESWERLGGVRHDIQRSTCEGGMASDVMREPFAHQCAGYTPPSCLLRWRLLPAAAPRVAGAGLGKEVWGL